MSHPGPGGEDVPPELSHLLVEVVYREGLDRLFDRGEDLGDDGTRGRWTLQEEPLVEEVARTCGGGWRAGARRPPHQQQEAGGGSIDSGRLHLTAISPHHT